MVMTPQANLEEVLPDGLACLDSVSHPWRLIDSPMEVINLSSWLDLQGGADLSTTPRTAPSR